MSFESGAGLGEGTAKRSRLHCFSVVNVSSGEDVEEEEAAL